MPKLLFISEYDDGAGEYSYQLAFSNYTSIIFNGVAIGTSYPSKATAFNANASGSSQLGYVKKSSDGKTISWYSDDAFDQHNRSGKTYYYVAIG